VRSWLWCSLWLAACHSDANAPADKAPPPPSKPNGVYPDQFQCASIVTLDRLGELLGAAATSTPTVTSHPRTLAAPCAYEVNGEAWTFDFDCRSNFKETADALFAEYRATNVARTAKFDRDDPRDAGVLRSDAGVEHRRPDAAREISVGAKALDHNGVGLIFIDDDAPCYARVYGPDAARRLALATEIAAKLTPATAPMPPNRR
jgi:hypothetical protein